jgi:hypothetical protein
VTKDVVFDEPESLKIPVRRIIEREPGALSRKLLRWGVVGNVTQAKIAIAIVVIGGFMACTYFLEAALSGPDIPPRPPSPLYEEYVRERGL